ncbi:MAG: TrmH family RNA methyltransferase [Gammaproteobacteria bacterium]|nr:TrmH family RNA methyltransferase [Gammaproteobacteria bacterium]MCW9004638.1 TrmH family RNA methyltransferase [Gammaproteobacteria bacterium]MCW9055660.1 TrmH family RNA methyltransferase [Gammaproteobacteria bacterium]
MSNLTSAGKQREGKSLYIRQKSGKDYTDNIKIIAIDIKTPENLASVYRLADAAGCKHVVLVGDNSTTETKKFSRISRGAEKFLSIEKITHKVFLKDNKKYQPLIALEITTNSENLFETVLPEQCSFVIGNERQGIDEEILKLCERAIHLPMFGNMGSMNVSHALAILLFEWRRQMGLKKGPSI